MKKEDINYILCKPCEVDEQINELVEVPNLKSFTIMEESEGNKIHVKVVTKETKKYIIKIESEE